MGFTPEEVVDVLLNEKEYSPWIPYEYPQREMPQMDSDFHQESCVHQSVHNDSKSYKSLTTEAKRMIAEYCGLGGISPLESLDRECIGHVRFEDSTAYISYRNPEEDEISDVQVAEKALGRCQLVLSRITELCAWLQTNGWLCNHIVFISYVDGFRCDPIPMGYIRLLRNYVDELRLAPNSDSRDSSLRFVAGSILVKYIPPMLSASRRLAEIVDICALAVQKISVSLLSICEAHVGPIHPFFLDRPLTKIYLSGIDGPVSHEHKFAFQLGGLACLGLMLGSPIMVFGSGCDSVVHEDTRDILGTSVEFLLELWGPGRLIPSPPGSARTAWAIEIGGGCIYKPSDELTTSAVLHWAPGNWTSDALGDEVSNEQALIDQASNECFDITNQLYIGGLFSINTTCPSRLQHDLVPMGTIRQEIHELGTWKGSWRLQQVQAGLQAGQIANVTFNATWSKSASRTRKEKGLSEIGLNFVDQPWGLLVSLCTGVARRVPLREVIAEVFPLIVLAWLEAPETQQNSITNYKLRKRLREPTFRKWLSSQGYYDRLNLSKCIKSVLTKLSWTGVSPKSKLVTACTSERQTDGCVHISLNTYPLLATILKDTQRTATFASLTTECVVTDQHKCQETSHPEWNNKVTALATSVCQYRYVGSGDWEKLPNKGLENGRLYWMGHMNDNRRLVAEVSSNQGDEVVLKVADSQALWSFYLRAYEKIERMRAHYIALREQSVVGEEDAQEVLIVSG